MCDLRGRRGNVQGGGQQGNKNGWKLKGAITRNLQIKSRSLTMIQETTKVASNYIAFPPK